MCRAAQFIRWNALQLQSAQSYFALVILMACDWYEAFWTRTHLGFDRGRSLEADAKVDVSAAIAGERKCQA